MSPDTAGIERARRDVGRAAREVRRNAERMVRARSELERIRARGANAARLRMVTNRIGQLRTTHRALLRTLEDRQNALLRLSDAAFARAPNPDGLVATLDGEIPVALFPVRLETRFDGPDLKIRIFPDQIHLDTHEPELTDAEFEAGKVYWTERRTNPEGPEPWQLLTGEFGPPRARWIVRSTTPTNVSALATEEPVFPTTQTKSDDWTSPGKATLLPDRWVAIGLRDGVPLFRKWGSAVPDELAVTPSPDALDDGTPQQPNAPLLEGDPMRWLVDYDVAESLGMAITITPQDLPPRRALSGGVTELIVLGVDWTRSASGGADALASLFEAQGHSVPFGFLRPGTATNNTSDAAAGERVETPMPAAATAVTGTMPDVVAPRRTAARRLASALGLDRQSLDDLQNAGLLDAEAESALGVVLWASTLGHFFEDLLDPLVDEALAEEIRDHVVRWVHPGGPLGVLRVGAQPYGVLPVFARSRYRGGSGLEAELFGFLERARASWEIASADVPRMGRTGDPDSDLLELLQSGPWAQTMFFRHVMGAASITNTEGLEEAFFLQVAVKQWVRHHFGWPDVPRLFPMTAHPEAHRLRAPLVQAGSIPTGTSLEHGYLGEIALLLRQEGSRDALRARKPTTLLEAFVIQSAIEEIDRASARAVEPFRVDSIAATLRSAPQGSARLARDTRLTVPEMVGFDQAVQPAESDLAAVDTPEQLADLVIPELTGSLKLSDFVTANEDHPAAKRHGSFRDELTWLAPRAADTLDRAFRGFVDACSHRLDVWYTSLATKRLEDIRQRRPEGINIGAYGYVRNLRPGRTPTSLGYIHAPSIAHATTAAILRSGHLTHRDAEHEALDIDLSSDRVQLALPVLDGVTSGQSLAALIGYRVERLLKETDLRLAKFILPLRRIAPLEIVDESEPSGPVESVAERNVVDGVNLLERWGDDPSTVLSELPAGTTAAERAKVGDVLDTASGIYDAVADLMVAEVVHQTALGNYERAGAAMAALDKQERIPQPDVIRTPRTGTDYQQSVGLVVGNSPGSGGWPTDVRSRLEPRLNGWIASLLPDPGRVRFTATRLSDGVEVEIGATDLGLSPLSLVALSGVGGSVLGRSAGERSKLDTEFREETAKATALGKPLPAPRPHSRHELSETGQLEEWVAWRFSVAQSVSLDVHLEDALILSDADPTGQASAIGLGRFRIFLKWVHRLVTEAEPASATDFAPPSAVTGTGFDLVELGARVDRLISDLGAAIIQADAALASESSRATIRAALVACAALGAASGVPRHVRADSAAEARSVMRTQLVGARAELERRRSIVHGLESAFSSVSEPTETQLLVYHRERTTAVVGEAFPLLPRFRVDQSPATVDQIKASLGDAGLLGGDDLEPRAWIDRLALVHPGVDRLAKVLTGGELLASSGAAPGAVRVLQLPYVPGDRWLALPRAGRAPSEGEASLVLHAPKGIDPSGFMAGMICAHWTEHVPGEIETTALSFHFDAPGARAPQAVLLAVPPDLKQTTWSLDDLVETVRESSTLARIRGVSSKQLPWAGAVLPAIYLPESASAAWPSVNLFDLLKVSADLTEAINVVGKED